MSPFLQLIFVVMSMLLFAKAGSYIAVRLGQPTVLGELLVGLILGPTLLNITHLSFIGDSHLTETIIQLGEIGVLLLMFIAGLELHLNELTQNTRVAALAGILGVIFPVLMGWGLGLLFAFPPTNALFLGLILGATSVSISAQTLMELGTLRTRVGLGLLGAAVFDDILVILLLSIVLALTGGAGGALEIAWVFARIVIYLAGSMAFGQWVLPALSRRISRLPISQASVSLGLVILLFYGLTAEIVGGMAAITGAFLAGLFFARTPEKKRMEAGIHALAYGLFVPLFFVSIGLSVNLRELNLSTLGLLAAISVVGILGKWFGSGLGARLGGFNLREAVQLGAGMISRGEVGLIVAGIGQSAGFVKPAELSAVLGMVILTTLVTPPLLRALFGQTASE